MLVFLPDRQNPGDNRAVKHLPGTVSLGPENYENYKSGTAFKSDIALHADMMFSNKHIKNR